MNLDKKINGIYAITPNQTLDFGIIERIIIQNKINILQYRTTATTTLKLSQAKQLQQLCWKHHTLFIINNDIDLASKINADGVHLGKNDKPIQYARQQLSKNCVIGVSCYNDINLAQDAQNQGANYVAFGALFPSPTKPDTPHCSLDIIKQAKQILDIPVVGIGGIDFQNQQHAFDAGCDAVAMISALFNQ